MFEHPAVSSPSFCATCGGAVADGPRRGPQGEGPPAPRPYVSGFSGPAAECTLALRRAGVTQAQALVRVNEHVATAVRMLRKAADSLAQGRRSAATEALFLRIFRVRPAFVPTWMRPSARIRDRGDVVAVRCRRVAELLESRRIRYFCSITSANCPDCGNDNSPYACSSWGSEGAAPNNSRVICLGSGFWDDMRAGNRTGNVATLMHEPFHIYFGRYVTEHSHPNGTSVGKFGGINCIVQFVFEVNGVRPPARVGERCTDTAVRGELFG